MQLSDTELRKAYRLMRTIRAFEDRIKYEFEAGNLPGFVHFYTGQEGNAVGMCMNLTDADKIGSTHRGHGHCIAKGCEVKGMMHEIYGRADGLCKGKGGSMHIADLSKGMLGANAIVGGAPPLAAGAALAAKIRGDGTVAVAFCGDGGSNQGMTFEALNLAVVLQLPCIFFFENNGFGEGTAADYAVGSKDIAGRAAAFGLPAVKVDGTDFFAVHEASREAVERARGGGGPSVIESQVRRFYGHFSGDPQSYRKPEEIEATRRDKDVLKFFRARVLEAGQLERGVLDAMDAEIDAEIDAAVRSAEKSPMPEPGELLTNVYASY